jgi:arylsulfatase A-like enzyme
MNRRHFLATALAGAGQAALAQRGSSKRPNILLIMTDDQGWGDISLHGNDKIKTPNMDRIAKEGMQFTQFHVCPVCSPTRSTLMTGRYNYRTGVVDTYLGRSLMRPDEVTLAEVLGPAGYKTGIFGKWHLGDNYPMRPGDQGFQESIVIKGGGLGQPSDFPGGGSYTNPILLRNGTPERFQGYCTDIYFREAMRWIESNKDQPWFVYLPTNAPHTPLEIEDRYVEPYRKLGVEETTAKIYGMCANIDENMGKMLTKLKDLKLDENTLVIFMTDNGPQQKRYTGVLRGLKGTVYEGGTRVPFFVRWPSSIKAGTESDRLAGHIDVFPTLLEVAGVKPPSNVKLDGRSLMPLIRNPKASWQDRTMFFQWHRGDVPELYRACAARTQRWKLVNGKELYDLDADPSETKDVAAQHPDVVAKLRSDYEAWFKDVSSRGYEPSPIFLGDPHENPVMMTRQDWRGPGAGWEGSSVGHWRVKVVQPAEYEFSVRFPSAKAAGKARVKLNGASLEKSFEAGTEELNVGRAKVAAGLGNLEAEIDINGTRAGAHYITVRKV